VPTGTTLRHCELCGTVRWYCVRWHCARVGTTTLSTRIGMISTPFGADEHLPVFPVPFPAPRSSTAHRYVEHPDRQWQACAVPQSALVVPVRVAAWPQCPLLVPSVKSTTSSAPFAARLAQSHPSSKLLVLSSGVSCARSALFFVACSSSRVFITLHVVNLTPHVARCILPRASCPVHPASCIVQRASCIMHRAACVPHGAGARYPKAARHPTAARYPTAV
jgi:hypothetical protein